MMVTNMSYVGGNEDNDDNIYQDFILCDIFKSGNDVSVSLRSLGRAK